MKYPWRGFWNRRALRKEDKWVRRIASEHADSLHSDKPDATEGEQRIIEIASVSRACIALILDAMARAGGVETEQGFMLMRELRGFLALEQKMLTTIGLERRARAVEALPDFIEARAKLAQDADQALPKPEGAE